MSSIDTLPKQDEANDRRPIGRFLLSCTAKDKREFRPKTIYEYAKRFEVSYKQLLDTPWSSHEISKQEIADHTYWLEFQNNAFDADYYVWRLSDTRTMYEMYANSSGDAFGVAYEFTGQRQVLQRHMFRSAELLHQLQAAVEYMTTMTDFYQDIIDRQRNLIETLEKITELKGIGTLTIGQERNLRSLESSYATSGFTVGSKTRYNANSLINPSCRLPVHQDRSFFE